jgi:ABC-type lipoprotein export system ATPase subunit
MRQLKELASQGFTVAVVTHEEDIGSACDRVIRIRDGQVENGDSFVTPRPKLQAPPNAAPL